MSNNYPSYFALNARPHILDILDCIKQSDTPMLRSAIKQHLPNVSDRDLDRALYYASQVHFCNSADRIMMPRCSRLQRVYGPLTELGKKVLNEEHNKSIKDPK